MIHYLALFIGYTIIGILLIVTVFLLTVSLYVIITELTDRKPYA